MREMNDLEDVLQNLRECRYALESELVPWVRYRKELPVEQARALLQELEMYRVFYDLAAKRGR